MNLLNLITPVNLLDEEKKFFRSSSYHPQFRYQWDQGEIDEWVTQYPIYASLSKAIVTQETENITALTQELFQVPWNEQYYDIAREQINVKPLEVKISPLEIKKAYAESFEYFHLPYTAEIVNQAGFVGRPQPSKKRVIISNSLESYFFPINSSCRHELCHVIRYENGRCNLISMNNHYLPTEEGLASYCQDFWQGEETPARFQHAAEYAVTKVTREGSLRDAVEYLVSIGFPPRLAWQRAVRHKFGFKDTSRPGDIMKPAMYFAHSQKIGALTIDERLRLFVGKIALEELPNYPEYRGKWSKKELTDFFFGI
jgi:hypothetical protein